MALPPVPLPTKPMPLQLCAKCVAQPVIPPLRKSLKAVSVIQDHLERRTALVGNQRQQASPNSPLGKEMAVGEGSGQLGRGGAGGLTCQQAQCQTSIWKLPKKFRIPPCQPGVTFFLKHKVPPNFISSAHPPHKAKSPHPLSSSNGSLHRISITTRGMLQSIVCIYVFVCGKWSHAWIIIHPSDGDNVAVAVFWTFRPEFHFLGAQFGIVFFLIARMPD